MPTAWSRIECRDGAHDFGERARGFGAPLQPVKQDWVVEVKQVSVLALQVRGQAPIPVLCEIDEQQVQLKHAAATAPQHASVIATVVHYTSPMSIAKQFAVLDFAGPDAASFLQGYLTADLDALDPQRALPMTLCNLKGRVIVSGWIFGSQTRVRLIVHATAAESVQQHLRKYLLFAKSKFTLPSSGLRFAPGPAATGVELAPTGYWAVCDVDQDDGHEAFADACIDARFVVVGKPVSETFLPQMLGLTEVGAVSFSKGCYLGQEVVARAQHRGQVKRGLQYYPAGGVKLATGDDLVVDDATLGTVVAVGSQGALACVRR